MDLPTPEYEVDFFASGPPDETVETGFQPHEGATHLEIYRTANSTYVVPYGEVYNASPWMFDGRVETQVVLAEYLAAMKESG